MDKQIVFDRERQVDVVLRAPEGTKTVRVRFPSDEEWTERQRKRKVVIKHLGRGVTESSVPNSVPVDEELFRKIAIGEGPEVDAFEAARIIDELSFCEVDNVTEEAEGYRISLRVPGGTVAVILRIPSAREVFDYRRSFARVLDLPFGRQEMTINLGAVSMLFGKILVRSEGYAGDVPVIHQSVALQAMLDKLERGFAEDRAGNF